MSSIGNPRSMWDDSKEKEYQPQIYDSLIENTGEYKNNIVDVLLENEKIIRLLYYNTKDALTRELDDDIEVIKDKVRKNNISLYQFEDEIYLKQKTFITIEMGAISPYEGKWKEYSDFAYGHLLIYTFTHMDLQDMDEGIRKDMLRGEIYKSIKNYDKTQGGNDSHKKWIGKSKLEFSDRLAIHNNKLSGYVIDLGITGLS